MFSMNMSTVYDPVAQNLYMNSMAKYLYLYVYIAWYEGFQFF
jgi:hypothetical protein